MRLRLFAFVIAATLLTACSSSAPSRGSSQTAEAPPAAPVKIVSFYSSEPVVSLDAPATLCYGVENAASVKLTPPVEAVWPSMSRCFTVNPRTAIRFTLTAIGKDGQEVTKDLELKVGKKNAPAGGAQASAEGPRILFFLAPSPEIPAGLPATMCYGVAGATSVSMTPDVGPLEPKQKFCATVKPEKTTTYILTAKDSAGNSAKQELTIKVK
jgi:hypothetical protein